MSIIHDGVRLLGSSLTVNSKDGHGHWFDEIVLTTQGLGNDPYESATLRVQKNRLYRYDMTLAAERLLQSGPYRCERRAPRRHDVWLAGSRTNAVPAKLGPHPRGVRPRHAERSRAHHRAGVRQPAATFIPIFRNVRQQFNEYRLGGDGQLKGFRFTVQRRWEYFQRRHGR